jgi:hypothetical protein
VVIKYESIKLNSAVAKLPFNIPFKLIFPKVELAMLEVEATIFWVDTSLK